MARRTWWKVGALLAAMMVFLTMLPATALAAAPENQVIYVGGVEISSTGYWTTDGEGNVTAYTGKGTPTDNYIHYDVANNTLTLHNATIKESVSIDTSTFIAGAAIGVHNQNGVAELTIKLEGVNTIEDVGKGIYVLESSSSTGAATLTITSESGGSLDASASQTGIWVQSNSGDATLTIRNAKVEATGTSRGVNVQSSQSSTAALTVDGGSLTASGSPGILYDSTGSGTVPKTTALAISDSAIVDARGGGIGAGLTNDLKEVSPADDSVGIVFDRDDGTVYGSVTLQEDLTIGEGESLNIPSGVSLTIDSGATLTNKGTVTTEGGTLTNNGKIENSGTLPNDIEGAAPPSITTSSLNDGIEGVAYGASFEANGSPTSWEITSGSLPAGLSLNESAGKISGTPAANGTFTFTVKATNNGGSDSEEFTLTISQASAVPVAGVSLNKTSTSLYVGDTETLTATVEPFDATNKNVAWSTSDASVATVTDGVVTAVSEGTATITVTTEDSTKTASCTVTVTVPVTGVTLSQTQARLYYNGTPNTLALTAMVAPDNATDKAVTWTSSNSVVATVDGSGNVTAVASGTATITVTTTDGGKTATCLVTVTGVYIPPRPTGPDWGDVAGDIADAEPGSTVKVDMDGKTVLPGEVLDELAGSDVTLALDMGDGLFWEIYGGDVPKSEGYDDVDLGVALGGDDIPADVANLVTGESGSVQVSLEHDGPFGFELTLVAPLGEEAAGLVANLYRYNDETGSLGYEATAQVDGEGVARLPFDHASSWLVALDSRGHALPFPDALEGEWYSEAVRWAWLGGVMTGYGDGSGLFGTSSSLTRAEAAVVLWRLAGEPVGASGLPADCDPSGFYAEAASWALGAGVFSGYSGDAFGPTDTITREQLATVLWRAAGSPEAGGDLSSFSDAADVSDFADVAMRWAVSAGVLRGQGDGDALDPQGACTRAQLATMLYRLAAAE